MTTEPLSPNETLLLFDSVSADMLFDVVPALNILQQVRLWDTVGQVEVQNVAADGTVKRAMEERIQSITLANLVLALSVLVVSALTRPESPDRLQRFFALLHTPVGEEANMERAGLKVTLE